MNDREIRDYDKIPEKDRKNWSEPFSEGEILDILGKKMQIVRIKKMRGEIHLRVLDNL